MGAFLRRISHPPNLEGRGLDDAIEAWKNVVRLRPNFSQGHENLGYALYSRSRFSDCSPNCAWCWLELNRLFTLDLASNLFLTGCSMAKEAGRTGKPTQRRGIRYFRFTVRCVCRQSGEFRPRDRGGTAGSCSCWAAELISASPRRLEGSSPPVQSSVPIRELPSPVGGFRAEQHFVRPVSHFQPLGCRLRRCLLRGSA